MSLTHIELGEKSENNNIKVDGTPETFEGGAIRCSKTGKGRYDLIPEEFVAALTSVNSMGLISEVDDRMLDITDIIYSAYREKWVDFVRKLSIWEYYDLNQTKNNNKRSVILIDPSDYPSAINDMLRQLAVHYENGAEIYGENNWKHGIPAESFISSCRRHLSQYIIGMNDENHFISAIWNAIGAWWVQNSNRQVV